MTDLGCLHFAYLLANARAHHVTAYLDAPGNDEHRERFAKCQEIELDALLHLCECETHRDLAKHEDACLRHEAIIWLERYLHRAMDDINGLPRGPHETPLLIMVSNNLATFMKLRIEHARACDKHGDELEELLFLQQIMGSVLPNIAGAASADTELLTDGDPEKESHLGQFLTAHLMGKKPIEE